MESTNVAQIVKSRLEGNGYTEKEISDISNILVGFVEKYRTRGAATLVMFSPNGGFDASLWLVPGEWNNFSNSNVRWDELAERTLLIDETRIGRCVRVQWAVVKTLEVSGMKFFGESVYLPSPRV